MKLQTFTLSDEILNMCLNKLPKSAIIKFDDFSR